MVKRLVEIDLDDEGDPVWTDTRDLRVSKRGRGTGRRPPTRQRMQLKRYKYKRESEGGIGSTLSSIAKGVYNVAKWGVKKALPIVGSHLIPLSIAGASIAYAKDAMDKYEKETNPYIELALNTLDHGAEYAALVTPVMPVIGAPAAAYSAFRRLQNSLGGDNIIKSVTDWLWGSKEEDEKGTVRKTVDKLNTHMRSTPAKMNAHPGYW